MKIDAIFNKRLFFSKFNFVNYQCINLIFKIKVLKKLHKCSKIYVIQDNRRLVKRYGSKDEYK